MKNKISKKNLCVICLDAEGHFHVAKLKHRKIVMNNIKLIEDGKFWKNKKINAFKKMGIEPDTDLKTLKKEEWFNFIHVIHSFTNKGTMDIAYLE